MGVVTGRDNFAILPTGYGKSLRYGCLPCYGYLPCYGCLPRVFDPLESAHCFHPFYRLCSHFTNNYNKGASGYNIYRVCIHTLFQPLIFVVLVAARYGKSFYNAITLSRGSDGFRASLV